MTEPSYSRQADVLDIEVLLGPGRAIVRLHGELDLAGRARLGAAIADCGKRDVVVDVARLTFLDCSGYTALEDAAAALAAHGHELCLVSARGAVARLLELLGPLLAADVPDAAASGLLRARR
jgi:anti-sigma B factor antagonist